MNDEVEHLKYQIGLLANALGECIMASGIVRKDIDSFTYPQLLMFANDLKEMLQRQYQDDSSN